LATVLLIYLPIGDALGLFAIPAKMLGLILSIVFMYIFTADVLKVAFFKLTNKYSH
jgi:hypothetical protein